MTTVQHQRNASAKEAVNEAMAIADEIKEIGCVPEGTYIRLANSLKSVFEFISRKPVAEESDTRTLVIEMMMRNPAVLQTIDQQMVDTMFQRSSDRGPFTSRFIADLFRARLAYNEHNEYDDDEYERFIHGVVNAYLSDARMTARECRRPVVGRELTADDYQLFSNVRSLVFKLVKGTSIAYADFGDLDACYCIEEICRAISARLEKFAVAPDVLYPRFFYAFRSMDAYMFSRISPASSPLTSASTIKDTRRSLQEMLSECPRFALWICKNMHRNVHRMSEQQKKWATTAIYWHVAEMTQRSGHSAFQDLGDELRHYVVPYLYYLSAQGWVKTLVGKDIKKYRIKTSLHRKLSQGKLVHVAGPQERFFILDGSYAHFMKDLQYYQPFLAGRCNADHDGMSYWFWKEKEIELRYGNVRRIVKAQNKCYITIGEMLDAAFKAFEDDWSKDEVTECGSNEVDYVLTEIMYWGTTNERGIYNCLWEPQFTRLRVNKKRPLGDEFHCKSDKIQRLDVTTD